MNADMERRPENESPDATSQVQRNRKRRQRTHRDYCAGTSEVVLAETDQVIRSCTTCNSTWTFARCQAVRAKGGQCMARALLPCESPEWCASHAAPFRQKRAAP